MKDNNYVTIQGWMVNQLKLTGNELMVYAIIYGFSQDNKSMYRGSIEYMSETAGISRQSVGGILKKLVEKGYITKHGKTKKGFKFSDYQTVRLEDMKKQSTESSEKCSGECKESLHSQGKSGNEECQESLQECQESLHHNNINISLNKNNITTGSAEPVTEKQKTKKPPLCEREPENDYERVEKAYMQNWDRLYTQKRVKTPKPITNNNFWLQARKLLKIYFEKSLEPEIIITALNKAMNDEWVLANTGYSLGALLSDKMLNKLINSTGPPSGRMSNDNVAVDEKLKLFRR